MAAKDHYQQVYATRADQYEALVSREDANGVLLPAVERLVTLRGARVVEAGAGTGRLTRLLAPFAAQLKAFDAAPEMLQVARTHVPTAAFAVADHATLPVADGWADVALEGWAFAHAVGWHPHDWERLTDQYLAELFRVLRPGGTALLFETLGTGASEPRAPTEGLAALYARWEARGFTRVVLRTDYRFGNVDEAQVLTQAFFGRAFEFEVRADGAWLPECTGLWWARKP
jgi:ubiquinone/menaquinone biosynthesis C-methylase UbiE